VIFTRLYIFKALAAENIHFIQYILVSHDSHIINRSCGTLRLAAPLTTLTLDEILAVKIR